MSECDIIYSVEDFLKVLKLRKPKSWIIWIDVRKEEAQRNG